jgi:hypothetical protein
MCCGGGRVEIKQSRHSGDYSPSSIDCWRLESVELYSSPLYAFMAWTGKSLSFMDNNCTSSDLENLIWNLPPARSALTFFLLLLFPWIMVIELIDSNSQHLLCFHTVWVLRICVCSLCTVGFQVHTKELYEQCGNFWNTHICYCTWLGVLNVPRTSPPPPKKNTSFRILFLSSTEYVWNFSTTIYIVLLCGTVGTWPFKDETLSAFYKESAHTVQ